MAAQTKIQKQVKLPLSKAVEIAWKNIRMRLSRSMLVTSGIVLAIAFLLAIQIGDAIADSMRRWIVTAPTLPEFERLRAEQKTLVEQTREVRPKVRDAVTAAPRAKAGTPAFDIGTIADGRTMDQLRADLGANLPDPKALQDALTADTGPLREQVKSWLDLEAKSKAITDRMSEPQQLQALLDAQGVKTKPDEVAASQLQQRWLLGLALLVAFVGILNAMLMSVTERFREIGTMKCLGALDGFIVKLFLIESLFQGIVGTVIGVVIGFVMSLLMAWATYGHFAFVNMPWNAVAMATLYSAVIGVVLTVAGAVWPAWQAARMHPIVAMRVEA
ncbi:MAG: FtsX-like permease family protein [Tepidisphaeraceae bacterium]